ncbi:MAG: hypothetical protein AB7F86_06825 [Bdellovibrionales bacterium]
MIRIAILALLFLPPHISWSMVRSTIRIDGRPIKKEGNVVTLETARGLVLVPAYAAEGLPIGASQSTSVFVDIVELVKLNPTIFPK